MDKMWLNLEVNGFKFSIVAFSAVARHRAGRGGCMDKCSWEPPSLTLHGGTSTPISGALPGDFSKGLC